MKIAYMMLNVKDGSEAVLDLALPWMMVFGTFTTLITVMAWLFSWEIIQVIMTTFAVFSAAALGVGLALFVGALADLMISLLGYNEVELEERHLFS